VKPATTASAQSTSTLASSASASGEYVYYTVRSGDNIWAIAKKYQGVSPQDILNLNNISDATKIKPGQKLKIKPL
jgi:membrane-bound lytic murein transglycosylase D